MSDLMLLKMQEKNETCSYVRDPESADKVSRHILLTTVSSCYLGSSQLTKKKYNNVNL